MPSIYWEYTKSWYSGMGFCSLLQLFHSMHEFHMSAKILEKIIGLKKKKWFQSTIHRIAASLWMVLFMFLLVCSPQLAWGRVGGEAREQEAPSICPTVCASFRRTLATLTFPSSWKAAATGCGCFCICRLSVSPEHCKWFLLNIIVPFWSMFLKLNF